MQSLFDCFFFYEGDVSRKEWEKEDGENKGVSCALSTVKWNYFVFCLGELLQAIINEDEDMLPGQHQAAKNDEGNPDKTLENLELGQTGKFYCRPLVAGVFECFN